MTATENKIAFARQFYNNSVNAYNIRRQSFPAVLAAASLGSGRSSSSTCPRPNARCRRSRCAEHGATTDFIAAQKANRRNTLLLLVVLTALAAATGYAIGWVLEGEAPARWRSGAAPDWSWPP